MGTGRKPKPTHLKIVQGTDRKDRTNKNEPEYPKDGFSTLFVLSEREREWLKHIEKIAQGMGISSHYFSEIAALIAQRCAEIEYLRALIKEQGSVYMSVTTQREEEPKSHPAVAQRNAAMRHLHSLLAEFGLTPSAITRISVGNKEDVDPFKELFANDR